MTKVNFKKIATDKIFEGPAFKIERNYYETCSGYQLDRDLVVHAGAVVVLPVQEDGTVLMLRQYRHAISSDLFELPAGTLEEGESPESCAKREIREETGFAAKNWQELGTLHPAPGFCNEIQYGFLATGLSESPLPQDDDEFIEVVPMSLAEIEQRIIKSEITDAKTISFLFRARLSGKLS